MSDEYKAVMTEACKMDSFIKAKADTGYQWVTTAPNPYTPATGFDAGQRGWRLHAIEATADEKFRDLDDRRSLCGILPPHGWGLDLFIVQRCSRCLKKWRAMGLPEISDKER